MGKRWLVLATASLAAVTTGAATRAAGPAPAHEWHVRSSGVVGSVEYDQAEASIVDAPFDDHGADLENLRGDELEQVVGGPRDCSKDSPIQPGPAQLSPVSACAVPTGRQASAGAAGDYDYPDGLGGNAADIVEVDLAADATTTFVRVRLNDIVRGHEPALMIVLDNALTLVAHDGEADLDGNPVEVWYDDAAGDVDVAIPRTSFDPGIGVHAFFVGAGLWDSASDNWFDPSPLSGASFYDVAFVPDEAIGYWHETRQASDIARSDLAKDSFDVDFSRLVVGCGLDPCLDIRPHASELSFRVFRSTQDLGEGIASQDRYAGAAASGKVYRSPYQPYALYDPHVDPAAPSSLVLLLHPLGGNYMTFPMTSLAGIRRWADQVGALVAMPQARGEAGWYENEAETDVLEVWRDVASHYAIDPDRVFLAGVGMGGYGVYRLSNLYPDLFAGAIVWAGPVSPNDTASSPGTAGCSAGMTACGGARRIFGNASNLPMLVFHGVLDEEVPITGPNRWTKEAAAAGQTVTYFAYSTAGADTAFPSSTADQLTAWFTSVGPRDRTPTQVQYRVLLDGGDCSPAGAYWLRSIVCAPGREESVVSATRSMTAPHLETSSSTGSDSLGTFIEQRYLVREPSPTNNLLRMETRGVSELTVPADVLSWDMDRPITIMLETDSELTIHLEGRFSSSLSVHGADFSRSDDGVEIMAHDGVSTVTIIPL